MKTTWDYRVVRSTTAIEGTYSYAIHEAFYGLDANLVLTEEAITSVGDTLEGLRQDLKWMAQALDHPVLEWDGEAWQEVKG